MRQTKQRSSKSRNYRALGRAFGVVAAVVIIVSGVTYAALQSQQVTLSGNSIATATANLSLSVDGISYGTANSGFSFTNLIPGGPAVPTAGNAFWLKNGGGTSLALKMAVSSTPTNLNGVDLSKVNIILTTVGSGTPTQSFNLLALMANGGVAVTGTLASGVNQQYKLQAAMDTDAVNGSTASLGSIDLTFNGTAVAN